MVMETWLFPIKQLHTHVKLA